MSAFLAVCQRAQGNVTNYQSITVAPPSPMGRGRGGSGGEKYGGGAGAGVKRAGAGRGRGPKSRGGAVSGGDFCPRAVLYFTCILHLSAPY